MAGGEARGQGWAGLVLGSLPGRLLPEDDGSQWVFEVDRSLEIDGAG